MQNLIFALNRKAIIMKFLNNIVSATILGSVLIMSSSCTNTKEKVKKDTTTFTIAFGSCAYQDHDQPILYDIVDKNPDLFIYLGDNIYGDSRVMDTLRAKYNRLGSKDEFKKLRASTEVLAVWDDHDYGENDAGKYYPFKEESKEIFLEFWEEPANSPRRDHPGIYHTEYFDAGDKKIQVILLDTRTFRDNLTLVSDTIKYKNGYQPTLSPDSTILGDQQWNWLKGELSMDADIRIIASSIQFSHEYNGWESWTNVPAERKRMTDLIAETKANGVIFISGDVHWGELSKLNTENTYPIYDVTSSGLTQDWHDTEENINRIGEVVRQNNFGMIEIAVNDSVMIDMVLQDIDKNTRVKHTIPLSEISF